MADDKLDLVVEISAHTQGLEGVARQASLAQDAVESLSRAGEIGEEVLKAFSDAGVKISASLGDMGASARRELSAFEQLQKGVRETSKALQEIAQEHVVAGGRNPLQDLVGSGTLGVDEAREILAVREAERISAEQVAKAVIEAEEQKVQKVRESNDAIDQLQTARRNEELAELKAAISQRAAEEDKAFAKSKSLGDAEEQLSKARRQRELAEMRAFYKERAKLEESAQKKPTTTPEVQGGRNYGNFSVLYDAGIKARQDEAKAWSDVVKARMNDQVAAEKQAAASNQATKAVREHSASLPTLRYALYDVSTTFAVAGAAMTGFSVLALKSGMDYERAFADVIRTNDDLVGSSVAAERSFQRFVNMAGEIPVAFRDLSEIGTLAGQLGVATGRMDDFTRATAMFSATTGESIDTTATAFGRLDALLPDVQGNYEALGSSILNVGINSVATEGEVIKISTQLAGVGRQAGLTADEVIGLSGALASVGVQPELARGTITRLFGQISRAVSVGGENLQGFAAIAGTTADQFSAKWGSDAMGATLDIFQGIRDRGAEAESALRAVGITSVRDVPAILRLSQTMDSVLVPALADAEKGFREGTQLSENYGVISETLASKLQILANNFQSLMAALGDSTGLLGSLVDAANGFLKWARELQSNPVTAFFSQFAVIAIGVVGVLALLSAAVVRGAAGMVAFRTAMKEAGIASTGLRANLAALTATIAGVNTQSVAASGGVSRLNGVMGKLGIASLALMAVPVAEWIHNIVSEAAGAAVDVNTLTESLQTLDAGISKAVSDDFQATLDKALTSISVSDAMFSKMDLLSILLPAGGLQQVNVEISKLMGGIEVGVDAGLARIGERSGNWVANLTQDWAPGLASFVDTSVGELGKFEDAFIQAWESAASETQKQAVLDAYAELEARVVEAGGSASDMAYNFADFHDVVGDGVNTTLLSAEALQLEEEALASLADEMNALVDDVFGAVNAQYALQDALMDVGSSLVENGALVAFTGDSMQNAIKTIISQSGGAGTAAANLQVFFDYLVQGGYASASQLMHLQAVIAGLLNTAGGKVSAPTLQMPNFSAFEAGMKKVQRSSRGAAGGVRDVGKAARETRKEVRTLLDYASDLSGMWTRAFNFRFDRQSTLDSITESFRKIREEAEEAARRVRDLRNDIASLSSDISIQEYFLSIAVEYGDTKRATAIEADLAKKRADLADKSKDLQDEQNKLNKGLTGNSASAIQNREAVTSLVKKYQEHLKALAESGVSQGALVAESERLKAEFLSQGQALGFSATELGVYAASFTDMARIINATPFNVTVDLSGLDPAFIAIREFTDKANAALSTIGNSGGGGGGGGIGSGIPEELWDQMPAVGDAGTGLGDASRQAFMTATKTPFTKEYAGIVYDSLMAGEITIDEAAGKLGLSGEAEFMSRYGDVLPEDFKRTTSRSILSSAFSAHAAGSAVGGNAAAGTNSGVSDNLRADGIIVSRVNAAQWSAYSSGSTVGSMIASGLKSGLSWWLDMQFGSSSKPRSFIRTLTGFQSGGYTGPGPANRVAGVVHSGEYVVRKQDVNQSTGLPYADALGRLMSGAPSRATAPASPGASASGTQVVALSAGTIEALRGLSDKVIVLDGQVIAKSSAQEYSNANNVGAY